MGLRELKKARLRRELIDRAIASFRARGLEGTQIRNICEACQVSEATFFNYFPNKESLLSEWVHGFLAGCAGEVEARTHGRGVRQRVRELSRDLAARVEDDREFMELAFARTRLSGSLLGAPGAADSTPRAPVQLMQAGQGAGELRRDVAAEQMAELLMAVVAGSIARWLRAPGAEELGTRLRRATDLMLDGCRRRNERVRAPVGAATRGD